MKKGVFLFLLGIVMGSFIMNLLIDNEATTTTINVIGSALIILLALFLRITFARDS
ncbi:hypothetical protein [Radiobacillus deserti]|uniref:hypothetical protein n=1 Tax=Radiobacillus deserti TaxID=2594883 RepID=UPI00131504EB|nr:hypothetical protein [Radiobacillus deserti]